MRKKMLQRGLAIALSAAMLLTGIQIPSMTAEAANGETVVFLDDMEDLSTEEAGWTISGWESKTEEDVEERSVNEWAANNTTKWWHFQTLEAQTIILSKTVEDVEPANYKVSLDADGNPTGVVKLSEVNTVSPTDAANEVSETITFGDWDKFVTTTTGSLTVAEQSSLKIEITINTPAEGWFDLDDIQLIREMTAGEAVADLTSLITECKALKESDYLPKGWSALQTEVTAAEAVRDSAAGKKIEEIVSATEKLQLAKDSLISIVPDEDAGLFVEKVDNLSEDFVRGVDISTYKSLIDSGVKFKDWDGEELDEVGFFKLLKSAGVNYVRIRVWNDPYETDADGVKHGYGAGNCDVEKAALMGAWATQAGLKVMVDFHYSDFWADPGRQVVPKAWKDYTVDQKATAVQEFTKQSLDTIIAAGADVGMVQVGNETTSGVCGESSWDNMVKIFKAGCAGVKEADPSILRVLHFTNPEKTSTMKGFADKLDTASVDYDVFASSYYPYWHGTRENLTDVLKYVADTYGKKVMVAETSWARTFDDGDGQPNVVRPGQNDDTSEYSASPQGQANEVRDVIEAVANVGEAGIGVMYWEPAWLPVNVYDASADNADEVLAANRIAWDEYGSGWASSYSVGYDPGVDEDTYGGSEWDNQAMFDFTGNPLPSLNVYKYVFSGASGEKKLVSIVESSAKVTYGEDIAAGLPTTVTGVFNDSSKEEGLNVTWSEDDIAAIDGFGTFSVNGTVVYGTGDAQVTVNAVCKVEVYPVNLLQDGSFEEGRDKWTIEGTGLNSSDSENPRTGKKCVAFYLATDYELNVSQSVTVEKPGTFGAFLYVQGGNAGQVNVEVTLSNDTQGTSCRATSGVNGWIVWQNPSTDAIAAAIGDTLTVKVNITGEAGSWGSIDDVYLYQKTEIPYYTITYNNMEGAQNASTNPAIYDGTKEITLADPSREGYTFAGWYTDSEFTTEFTGITAETTGNLTLYAKWEANQNDDNSVKVSGITLTPTTYTLERGKTFTLTPVIAPQNATDKTVTWTSSNAAVATVSSAGVVTTVGPGSATITATANGGSNVKASCTVTVPYQITYKLNSGTNNKSNPSTYYNQKVTLKNPTRKGYMFGGWYSNSNFKTKVTSIAKTSNKDITLYAKWTKVTVKKATVKKVANSAKKKAKVTIKKVTGAKGYQVQYCTSKKFKKGVKTKATTKTSLTLSGLKKGTTYYVRVRAYKVDSGNNKIYGKYSAVKKVKIKK